MAKVSKVTATLSDQGHCILNIIHEIRHDNKSETGNISVRLEKKNTENKIW